MESSDFLPPSRRLRFLRWRLPVPLTCSLIRYGGAEPYRGLAFTGGLRNSLATTGPPRFLGDPFVHMTTTFHPAGPPRQAIGPLSVISPTHSGGFCLRPLKRPRPQHNPDFEAAYTRPMHSLSTLRSRPLDRPRKTRFRLVAHLGRPGLAPGGSQYKVSVSLDPSSSSKLGLAHFNAGIHSVARVAKQPVRCLCIPR